MVFENFAAYLDWTFFGNTGMQYANALGIFIASTVGFWLFRHIILHWAKRLAQKTTTLYDDLIVEFIQRIRPPLYFVISLYVSAQFLALPGFIFKGIEYALAIGIAYYAIKGLQAIVSQIKFAFPTQTIHLAK